MPRREALWAGGYSGVRCYNNSGGGNAPLGFESRYSGTGISNGVSLSGKHNLRCFYFSVKWKEIMDTSKFLMFWVERERSLFMVALADICREIRKKGD